MAQFIHDVYGHEIIAFADPLKELVSEYLGREINKATDRPLLIVFGQLMKGDARYLLLCSTEERLAISDFLAQKYGMFFNDVRSPTFWVDQILRKMKIGKKYVIADLRYPIEAEMVKKCSAVLVKVYADKKICEERLSQRDGGFDPSIWDNDSEKAHETLNYDLVIDNEDKEIDMYLDFTLGLDHLREKSYFEVLNA